MIDPDPFRAPDPRMISFRPPPSVAGVGRHPPAPVRQAEPSPSGGRPAGDDRDDPGAPGDAGVRPFVITRGRTAPVDERLRIETQVVATPQAGSFVLDFECRRIVDLCATPLSVAEIAAALEVPIVVARVLVADLASVGAVAVHEQDQQVSRALLERILERVHAL